MDARTHVRTLPFELGFLALLTSRGIKPLSRWEDALSAPQMDALAAFGLEVAAISRFTVLGRTVPAVIFSKNSRYAEAFRERFDGGRLSHAARVKRLEGWFFGYPSCCVESFIKKPYAKNGLAPGDQRVLFHWACPGCYSTELLLKEYRRTYEECVSAFGYAAPVPRDAGGLGGGKRQAVRWLPRRAVPWAASMAALMLLPGFTGASSGDPHKLPAPDDSDADGLAYREEIILGMSAMDSDCNGNAVPDGEDVSLGLSAMIAALPRAPIPDGPYVIEHPAKGIEQCIICGAWINMGFVSVVHPLRALEADVPYVGLHYLGHGSLGYSGSVHEGRVSIDLLKKTLFPFDTLHIIGDAEIDSDGDELDDREEPLLSTDPVDNDTDGDSLHDGFQIAEKLVASVSALPRSADPDSTYLIEHPAFGLEVCAACGETMNMGTVEIVNPREHLTLTVPYISLHYLGHGGFCYGGDVHPSGRTLPVLLSTVLYGNGHSHEITITDDDDCDGLSNQEEIALGLNPDNPDCDLDGTPDGPDLAKFLHEAVGRLPEGPLSNETHRIDHLMRGVYECIICGEQINMGFMEIVDPVGAKSANLTYYSDHFMQHGSFSSDRPDLYPRADISALVRVLDVTVSGHDGGGRVPGAIALANAPNPFSSSTKIIVNLPGKRIVTISIFNVSGRKVRDLFSGEVEAGRNAFDWDGKGSSGETLPSGVYFCALRIDSALFTSKMLKLR